jgi:hypothetical protein
VIFSLLLRNNNEPGSNIIDLFSDVYCVFDMKFAKIHGELLRRLITILKDQLQAFSASPDKWNL